MDCPARHGRDPRGYDGFGYPNRTVPKRRKNLHQCLFFSAGFDQMTFSAVTSDLSDSRLSLCWTAIQRQRSSRPSEAGLVQAAPTQPNLAVDDVQSNIRESDCHLDCAARTLKAGAGEGVGHEGVGAANEGQHGKPAQRGHGLRVNGANEVRQRRSADPECGCEDKAVKAGATYLGPRIAPCLADAAGAKKEMRISSGDKCAYGSHADVDNAVRGGVDANLSK